MRFAVIFTHFLLQCAKIHRKHDNVDIHHCVTFQMNPIIVTKVMMNDAYHRFLVLLSYVYNDNLSTFQRHIYNQYFLTSIGL